MPSTRSFSASPSGVGSLGELVDMVVAERLKGSKLQGKGTQDR